MGVAPRLTWLTVPPLDLANSIVAAQLPPIHDEPGDRIIITTAKLNALTTVTADGVGEIVLGSLHTILTSE